MNVSFVTVGATLIKCNKVVFIIIYSIIILVHSFFFLFV